MSDAGALNSKKRLAQIVAILRKHHITQGLSPEKLRLIIEDLGPTFVKIGQIMSTDVYKRQMHQCVDQLSMD